jgi:transcription elongation factor Elf1
VGRLTDQTVAAGQLHATWMCGTVLVVEHFFTCPSCAAEISMVLDLSVHRHTYVEDCEVCCNALEISYTVEDEALEHFEVKTLE